MGAERAPPHRQSRLYESVLTFFAVDSNSKLLFTQDMDMNTRFSAHL